MRRAVLAFAAASILALGCKKSRGNIAEGGTHDATVVAPAASASRDASVSRDASADNPKQLLTDKERTDFASYAAALRAGRVATRAKRWRDAEAAFTNALDLRPVDARALAERGYARFLAGDLPGAETDLTAALDGGAGDATLGSQVWFNLGLVREAKKAAPDETRAAFAIANALAPSKAAQAKLGGSKACAADVRFHEATAWQPAASFDALDKIVAPEYAAPTAKERVCIQVHTALVDDTTVEKGACDGPPPWLLHHHHLMYTENLYAVVPRAAGGFLVLDYGRVGGWPARCESLPEPVMTLENGIVHVAEQSDGKNAAVDPTKTSEDGWQLPCTDVLGFQRDAYYDAESGEHLVTVFRPNDVGPALRLAGKTLTLDGDGCGRTIDLRAAK